MKHFVVVHDWADTYENGTTILGVAHTLEEAKLVFNESFDDEKRYAEEHDFTIYDECETVFDAGEDGSYMTNHTNLYIQMVQIKNGGFINGQKTA